MQTLRRDMCMNNIIFKLNMVLFSVHMYSYLIARLMHCLRLLDWWSHSCRLIYHNIANNGIIIICWVMHMPIYNMHE